MKKKVLSIVLAMSVMVAAFTGCGAEASVEESSVAASVEVSTEASSEVASTEASAEAGSEAASAKTGVEVDVEAGEWATAYDTYFDENLMIRDNAQLRTSVTQEGMTMDMIVATSGENFRMLMDFGTATMDIYAVGDKMYAKTVMDGEETWVYAPIESEEDTESVKSMNSTSMENENIVSYSYNKAVEMDGVTYDVLDMVVVSDGENQDVTCYIDRETQLVYKYIMIEEGIQCDMFIEDIEGIEVPAEAADATESTAEEIAMGMFGVIMAAAMASVETAQ